jgi:ADP-heptose:LPS heptosyltransferase
MISRGTILTAQSFSRGTVEVPMSSGWACVARFGGIGDNLIVASALRPLKRLGYKVEMLSDHKHGVVYQNNPFIDKLTILPDNHIPHGPGWGDWFDRRAKEYDQFFHLSHTCEGRHALNIGSSSFLAPAWYRRQICAGSYLETAHDYCGVAHDFGPVFFPTEEERTRALLTRDGPPESDVRRIGGPFIAWVVSGSRVDKMHPYGAMAIARIVRELGARVMMFGAGGLQFTHASEIGDHVTRQNGTNEGLGVMISPENSDPGGAGHWNTCRSLSQIMLADVVVTPDTGLAWAVAMEPMPKVVMVSHASAENITKHWRNTITLHADPDIIPCWPCHRLHDTIDTCTPMKDLGKAAACMGDISTELIVQAVSSALKGTPSSEALVEKWPRHVTLRDFPS